MKIKNFKPKSIIVPILMLALMWLGFLMQNIEWLDGCSGAIIPTLPEGLKGIILSPFLHGNLEHIISNSIPIAILLFLLYQFYPTIADKVLTIGWISSGLLVWLLPIANLFSNEIEYTCIIGASGIVYVLAFFIFFIGIFKRTLRLMAISLIVVLYYGGLIWGMLPEELFYNLEEPSRISWQSHLAGAIVGLCLAFIFRKSGERKKMYIWEFPNYYNEKDDKLWQKYMEENPEHFLELPHKKKDNIWDHLEEIRRKEKN